ncbi:MAG: HAD family phosphatase [Planctomycetes bacterium]|nr:HAD family phosphatase [Planctomycetota bacterium]
MGKIKAVIFDLGRVLVDIDFDRGLFRKLTGALQGEPSEVLRRLTDDRLFTDYNCGRIDPHEFHKLACEKIGLAMPFDEFRECWCDIFLMGCGMARMLELCAESVKVGILSDTDPMHWSHICKKFPAVANVKYPTLSFKTGATKPARECYLAAAEKVGCLPEECFFTDDLAANIDGAIAAGMDAVIFENADKLEQDLLSRGIIGA